LYSFEQTLSSALHKYHIVWLYLLNPVAPVVMTFQRVIYGNEIVPIPPPGSNHPVPTAVLPTWPWTTYLLALAILIITSSVAFFGAVAFFGRLEGNFAEEL
jgi:hypothetical protein